MVVQAQLLATATDIGSLVAGCGNAMSRLPRPTRCGRSPPNHPPAGDPAAGRSGTISARNLRSRRAVIADQTFGDDERCSVAVIPAHRAARERTLPFRCQRRPARRGGAVRAEGPARTAADWRSLVRPCAGWAALAWILVPVDAGNAHRSRGFGCGAMVRAGRRWGRAARPGRHRTVAPVGVHPAGGRPGQRWRKIQRARGSSPMAPSSATGVVEVVSP